MNDTPSGLNCLKRRSSAASSEDLLASTRAKSTTSFMDRCLRESESFDPKDSTYRMTLSTSHVEVYRGLGGSVLCIPRMILETDGC